MQPKKSLGQNFLTSEPAIQKITQAANISPDEEIIEVGPGRGVLTEALLKAGARVVAIEKDHRLIDELSKKFEKEIENKKLKLIEADVLEIDPKIFTEGDSYKIVANIPYYITGQFLRKFLSDEYSPSSMVLLLQKEVVERIIARDKKESILSVSVKVFGQPKKIAVVDRGSFYPAPNVDSAIISIEKISKDFFDSITQEKFFDVLKAGFSHKRKILLSNLTSIKPRSEIEKIFLDIGLEKNIRAEDLTLENWRSITEKI